jgi:hypothetical protein
MSYGPEQSRRSIDPHGYQPLVIDENVLNHDDRLEAFTGPTDRPCDWVSYLTRAELETFKNEIKQIEQNRSPYWIGGGELPAVEEKRFEMARLGILRAFARHKYAYGRRISYGDGVPFKRRCD